MDTDTGRPASASPPRLTVVIALLIGVLTAVTAFIVAPSAPPTAATVTGDRSLADDVSGSIDLRTVQGLTVARFDREHPDTIEWAFAGTADGEQPVDADTRFETGSILKVVTSMTLADMVERGETSLDRSLAEIFPDLDFADPRVGEATLEDLATHHSGIPTMEQGNLAQSLLPGFAMNDPYRVAGDPLELIQRIEANRPGSYEYSNIGYSALGAALAEESGRSFPTLAHERILDPLGMDDTIIVSQDVPAGDAPPHNEPGARVQPWHNPAYAPTGVGTWSTTADFTRLLVAVSEGSAPGIGALDPVHTEVPTGSEGAQDTEAAPEAEAGDEDRAFAMGLGWHILESPDHGTLTMHNGATYGSQTMIALTDSHGIVMMGNSGPLGASATAMSLPTALALLDGEPSEAPAVPLEDRLISIAITVAMTVLPPLLLLGLVLRRRTLVTQRPIDRLRVLSLSLGTVAWLIAAQRLGGWVFTPIELWATAAGVAAVAIVLGIWRFPHVSNEAGRWRWLHIPVFALSIVFSATLGGLTAWGLVIAAV